MKAVGEHFGHVLNMLLTKTVFDNVRAAGLLRLKAVIFCHFYGYDDKTFQMSDSVNRKVICMYVCMYAKKVIRSDGPFHAVNNQKFLLRARGN